MKINPQNEATYKVVGKLTDRSALSQEMANMCANLPIFRVVKGAPDQNDAAEQMNDADLALAENPRGEDRYDVGYRMHVKTKSVCSY